MPTEADLFRAWLIKQLGLTSSSLSEADLEALLYASSGGVASNRKFAAGRYYMAGDPESLSVNALTLDAMYLMPFETGEIMPVDRIQGEVTTAGAAGAVIRLGIYSSTADGLPDGLVVGSAGIDATTLGSKEATVNVTLNPGLYWVAIVSQVAACSVRSTGTHHSPYVANNAAQSGGATYSSYRQTGVNGALPATASGFTANGVPPYLFLRAA